MGGTSIEEKINEQIDAVIRDQNDLIDDKIADALENFDGGQGEDINIEENEAFLELQE